MIDNLFAITIMTIMSFPLFNGMWEVIKYIRYRRKWKEILRGDIIGNLRAKGFRTNYLWNSGDYLTFWNKKSGMYIIISRNYGVGTPAIDDTIAHIFDNSASIRVPISRLLKELRNQELRIMTKSWV